MKKIVPTNSVLIPEDANLIFKGVLHDVYQWDQTLYDGSSTVFEMLKRADTAVTIAIVEDKILLVEDEQPHGLKRTSFPGGRIEPGDKGTMVAAQRETEEETGYSFKNWRLVKVAQPINDIEWFVYIYLAWDVAGKQEPKLDAGERITVDLVDFAYAKSTIMADNGGLGENRDLFQNLTSIEDLLNLADYTGKFID